MLKTFRTFRVAEVFGPTIQGEGPCAGVPVYFIRFGGCDYRCAWCDSMHAVDPERVKDLPMNTVSEILDQLRALPSGAYDVVLSGGNPLLWDLTVLCLELQDMGYWIHVETQGTIFRPWLSLCDEIIVSPKPPSSGMNQKPEVTKEFLQKAYAISKNRLGAMNINLKYVAFDAVDLQYIRESSEYLGLEDLYISVGTRASDTTEDLLERYREIIDMVLKNPMPLSKVKILPQMHVLLWSHKLGV